MVEQENRLSKRTCKQFLAPASLLSSIVTHSQSIWGIVLGQGKGGAKPGTDNRAHSRSSVHRGKLGLGLKWVP